MNLAVVTRKIRSAGYRFREGLRLHRKRVVQKRKQRAVSSWIAGLKSSPPQVLIGSNFAAYGGVRHHIQAIARYSSLRVALAPPEDLLSLISPGELARDFREPFLQFQPRGIKAVHSHVFPWFIEWCRQHKGEGARWVHTYHLPYFPEHARQELEPWQAEINRVLTEDARHADVRLCVSRWQQTWLREEHGIETLYLPNGVDTGLCDRADGRRFLQDTGGEPFVLYAGRNDPVKNPADFVRLAQKLPSVRFVMVGRNLSAEVLRADWQVEPPANLSIHGELPHAALQDAIAAASLLVVTSKREGLPTVVLEGMTHSKPVVVPDEPGCMESVGQGEFGFIYRQGDIDDLAAQVEKGLRDKEIGAAARGYVLREYDWRVIALRLDAIYLGKELEGI